MTLIEALEVVLSLAKDNSLDEFDTTGEPDLEDEARRQTKALEIVERYISEQKG